MDFSGNARQRLSEVGVEPEVSPDGEKIAYLFTTGGAQGRTLVIYNRVNLTRDTVAVAVLHHEWLSDSRSLVYETTQNGAQEINLGGYDYEILGVAIGSGTSPAAMRDAYGFLFTGLTGDRLDGVYMPAGGQTPVRVSPTGTNARFMGSTRIIAQDSTGLIEITF